MGYPSQEPGIFKDTFRESNATLVGKFKRCRVWRGWDGGWTLHPSSHTTASSFLCGQAEDPTQRWARREGPWRAAFPRDQECGSQGIQTKAHNFEVQLLQMRNLVNPLLSSACSWLEPLCLSLLTRGRVEGLNNRYRHTLTVQSGHCWSRALEALSPHPSAPPHQPLTLHLLGHGEDWEVWGGPGKGLFTNQQRHLSIF